eukprot:7496039-Karenia_brevis.AAC.1
MRANPKPQMPGKPERSTPPLRPPPPFFDPMHRVIPCRDNKSMAMEIQEHRNTDHNGTLPLYVPLVGENYDLK